MDVKSNGHSSAAARRKRGRPRKTMPKPKLKPKAEAKAPRKPRRPPIGAQLTVVDTDAMISDDITTLFVKKLRTESPNKPTRYVLGSRKGRACADAGELAAVPLWPVYTLENEDGRFLKISAHEAWFRLAIIESRPFKKAEKDQKTRDSAAQADVGVNRRCSDVAEGGTEDSSC